MLVVSKIWWNQQQSCCSLGSYVHAAQSVSSSIDQDPISPQCHFGLQQCVCHKNSLALSHTDNLLIAALPFVCKVLSVYTAS